MNKSILIHSHIDYAGGVQRFLGDYELYESLLRTFSQDETMSVIRSAYANRDRKALFEGVHTMKGMSDNLDMTELYAAACSLTELLRAKESDTVISNAYLRLDHAYDEVCDGIERAIKV